LEHSQLVLIKCFHSLTKCEGTSPPNSGRGRDPVRSLNRGLALNNQSLGEALSDVKRSGGLIITIAVHRLLRLRLTPATVIRGGKCQRKSLAKASHVNFELKKQQDESILSVNEDRFFLRNSAYTDAVSSPGRMAEPTLIKKGTLRSCKLLLSSHQCSASCKFQLPSKSGAISGEADGEIMIAENRALLTVLIA
jgi:hypothetical protein